MQRAKTTRKPGARRRGGGPGDPNDAELRIDAFIKRYEGLMIAAIDTDNKEAMDKVISDYFDDFLIMEADLMTATGDAFSLDEHTKLMDYLAKLYRARNQKLEAMGTPQPRVEQFRELYANAIARLNNAQDEESLRLAHEKNIRMLRAVIRTLMPLTAEERDAANALHDEYNRILERAKAALQIHGDGRPRMVGGAVSAAIYNALRDLFALVPEPADFNNQLEAIYEMANDADKVEMDNTAMLYLVDDGVAIPAGVNGFAVLIANGFNPGLTKQMFLAGLNADMEIPTDEESEEGEEGAMGAGRGGRKAPPQNWWEADEPEDAALEGAPVAPVMGAPAAALAALMAVPPGFVAPVQDDGPINVPGFVVTDFAALAAPLAVAMGVVAPAPAPAPAANDIIQLDNYGNPAYDYGYDDDDNNDYNNDYNSDYNDDDVLSTSSVTGAMGEGAPPRWKYNRFNQGGWFN